MYIVQKRVDPVKEVPPGDYSKLLFLRADLYIVWVKCISCTVHAAVDHSKAGGFSTLCIPYFPFKT